MTLASRDTADYERMLRGLLAAEGREIGRRPDQAYFNPLPIRMAA